MTRWHDDKKIVFKYLLHVKTYLGHGGSGCRLKLSCICPTCCCSLWWSNEDISPGNGELPFITRENVENTVEATVGSCANEADNPAVSEWGSSLRSLWSSFWKLNCGGESKSSNGLYPTFLLLISSVLLYKFTSLKLSVFSGKVARLSVLKIAIAGSSVKKSKYKMAKIWFQ